MKKIFPQKNAYKILIIAMLLVGVAFLAMMAVVNAFPVNMIIGFIVSLLIMIAAASILCSRDKKVLRIIGIVIAAFFILIYGLGIYYMSTTYSMFARISNTDSNSTVDAKSVDVTEEPFNIYITGIDQWASEKGLDLERSDVNMIVTVSPRSRKILLTSIPRDAYVALHRTGTMDKLTHTGIYGVDETLNTITDWTGLNMNYYFKMNFTACVNIIKAIGGIDVYSPVAFESAISDYKYKKGWNHLDGREALYFARERKAFNEEDQLRVKNQMRVIKAMLNKVMSSQTLLTKYDELMDVMAKDMETNMPIEDIQALVKMQMSDLSTWNIKMQRMSGTYDMEVVASMNAANKYQVLKVSKKSFKSCLENIDKVMHPTAAEIAAATASRQKNSILSFLKSLRGNK